MKLFNAEEARKITETFNEKHKETIKSAAETFIDIYITPEIEMCAHNGKSWIEFKSVVYSQLEQFVKEEIQHILSSLGYQSIEYDNGKRLNVSWL